VELERPDVEVIAAYIEAAAACPTRAEALHGAARYCRNKSLHERGYEFAAQGLAIPYPHNAPAVEDWIYEYGLLDEFAINAYWTGRYAECVSTCDRLLSEGKLPTEKRDRVLKNKNFAISKQQEIAALSSPECGPFLKLLRAAREKEELGRPNDEVISAYIEASAACPTRAEALHGAARFCRNRGLYERGYEFAAQGLAIAYPKDAPALEDWIYEYGLLDELAVNAYWTARYAECVDACNRLLNEGTLPTETRERVLKNKQFAIDKLAEIKSPSFITSNVAAPQGHLSTEIPRIFHFITGLDKNFGGRPFSFVHYIAIRSALQVNKGFRARVYYHYEPSGEYWDAIKGDVELVPVDLPTEVFGNPVKLYAHKADVLRMRILLEQGGIYLDLDTICQRPFEPLLDGRVVMGQEARLRTDGSREVVGLCNATIIAPPNAEFLRLWYEAYRDFSGDRSGEGWNKFSVKVPMALAREHPELLRIEPASSFFWPSWDKAGVAFMFSRDCEFSEAYSFHLWEGESWSLAKDIDAKAVMTIDTTYNKVARRFVEDGGEPGSGRRGRGGQHHLSDGIERPPGALLCAMPATGPVLTAEHTTATPGAAGGMPIHLINLDRSTDRLAEFQKRNAHLRNVVRFAAVDGRTIDKEKLIKEGIVTRDCSYSLGALGSAMSHITLCRMAVDERRTVTIAEDDAIFCCTFEGHAERVLALLPDDWDVIFWGWNFDAPLRIDMLPGVSEAIVRCDQGRMRQNIDQFQALETSPVFVRVLHIWGIMCYTVSPKGAQALLDICLPLRSALIETPGFRGRFDVKTFDATLNTAHPSLKSFVCIPPLVVAENRQETSLNM
jgi:GR25 family glycosyltransferase involved in LPS biosynthesis